MMNYLLGRCVANALRLTPSDDRPVLFVSWAPGGSRILYSQVVGTNSEGETDCELHTVALDGSASLLVATLATTKSMPPVWSTDRTHIAFSVWDYNAETQALWIVEADGSDLHQVSDRLERGAVFPAWHHWQVVRQAR